MEQVMTAPPAQKILRIMIRKTAPKRDSRKMGFGSGTLKRFARIPFGLSLSIPLTYLHPHPWQANKSCALLPSLTSWWAFLGRRLQTNSTRRGAAIGKSTLNESLITTELFWGPIDGTPAAGDRLETSRATRKPLQDNTRGQPSKCSKSQITNR